MHGLEHGRCAFLQRCNRVAITLDAGGALPGWRGQCGSLWVAAAGPCMQRLPVAHNWCSAGHVSVAKTSEEVLQWRKGSTEQAPVPWGAHQLGPGAHATELPPVTGNRWASIQQMARCTRCHHKLWRARHGQMQQVCEDLQEAVQARECMSGGTCFSAGVTPAWFSYALRQRFSGMATAMHIVSIDDS